MKMRDWILGAGMLLCALGAKAHEPGVATHSKNNPIEADTTILAKEVVITTSASLKQRQIASQSPVAATLFSSRESDRLRIEAPKELSLWVPNLYAPDYGSRMTSSIYVRGLGSRIDQPVLGLNIDNIPILNKDAYDLDHADIARLEVLRGPQSTLYGRNTMGGVMNIQTLRPLDYEGVRLKAEYGSGNSRKVQAAIYQNLSPKLGIALSAHYGAADGLFRNRHTEQLCDHEEYYGGELKLRWRQARWELQNFLSVSRLTQGGYPYHSAESGEIAYNDPCSYERTSLVEGFTVRHTASRIAWESNTSYQLLDDCMRLDQDFTPRDYFTLEQDRQEHAMSQEFLLRSNRSGSYQWLVGAFGFFQLSDMAAPVCFKRDGLQELIIDQVEANSGYAPQFDHPEFPLLSDFDIRTYGAALYHESTLERGRWIFTLGLRLDHEWGSMDYCSATRYACRIRSNEIAPFEITGRLHRNSTVLLPRLSVLLRLGAHHLSNLYVNFSRGYKAGGFNTQMFSEVLQNALMEKMGASFDRSYDVDRVVSYAPEWSWNYELGGHLHLAQGDLQMDWALFWIDCRDQQLTVFPPGQTTGRMMTNAGRTCSMGGEFSVRLRPTPHLLIDGSYGYTHATFRHYTSGNNNYRGKRLPYAPEHTFSARMSYEFALSKAWRLIPQLDLRGAGPIRWNEANSLQQACYALLGASLRLEHARYVVEAWVSNLADQRYDTFYFKSVGREFLQQGLPRTWGVRVQLRLGEGKSTN